MKELFLTIVILTALFCGSCRESSSNNIGDLCKESLPASVYAERFTLIRDTLYTTLLINEPWQGARGIVHRYYLVPHHTKSDDIPSDGNIIRVPVESLICMSVTHAAMIAALEAENKIVGMSGTALVYTSSLRGLISAGTIREVGYEESLDREAIIELNPDLIIAYGVGGESAGYLSRIADVGIKILYNAEYLEHTPLGKAEWIKVFGALLGKEEKADSIFRLAETEYLNIMLMADSIKKNEVKVMLGLPWRDTWYISPGNSNINRLIEDAGGTYLWGDTRSEISMPFSTENVYLRALEADVWLNSGSAIFLKEIEKSDHRLATLPVFQQGHVFNNIKRVTPAGGNDYWETGTVRPGLVLRDLVYIFHTDYEDENKLMFYEQLR